MHTRALAAWLTLAFTVPAAIPAAAAPLLAGVGRVEITDRDAGPVHDPAFVRAVVLRSGETTAVLVMLDAVAVGGIGRIPDTYLPRVRSRLQAELGIPPQAVVVNASHCHAAVRSDVHELTVQAVKQAWGSMVPVRAGAGSGREDRISENRRLRLADGSEADQRRAYPPPADEDVAGAGPIDPQIGLLRLDRESGGTLAVVSLFACHPIMNPPSRGSSADFPGVSATVVEAALGAGATACFVQGCGGDINPIGYTATGRPADAEPLGALFGASVLAAVARIETKPDAPLAVRCETIRLPRATDYETRIAAIEARQKTLLASLKSVGVDFKAFLPLLLEERLAARQDDAGRREPSTPYEADRRRAVENYLHNVRVMEQFLRLDTNLALLRKNLQLTKAAGDTPLEAEVCGLRVGDFRLVTFPGELSVQVGLDIKKAAGQPYGFVAGYTNGYIFYTATTRQRQNPGFAQEDCDTLVAAEWQPIFEAKAVEMLRGL